MNFTPDQQKIIDARNTDLLVSAAAGSGKTAVLVERIIQLITDPKAPADIDSFLVVTFTRAAAAQMRDKISKAISDRLVADPGNVNLQRQSALVHAAQITTIDSFCQYVLRNSFSDIDLDPGFRIGDEGEMKLLAADVLNDLLEELYSRGDVEFLNMAETLATGPEDSSLNDVVMDLYGTAMSDPWPDEWLRSHAHDYDTDGKLGGPWYRQLVLDIYEKLLSVLKEADRALELAERPDGPYPWAQTIEGERDSIKALTEWIEADPEPDYDEFSSRVSAVTFDRLPACRDKSVDVTVKDRCKALRDGVKSSLNKLKENYFDRTENSHTEQMKRCGRVLSELCTVTGEFKARFDGVKSDRGILSFADCEHLALNILVKRNPDGTVEYTDTAREYRSHYRYVMIDEYQDSNLIQELLLEAVSGEEDGIYDRFMVGDVKQSIYRFRQADPEIFMDKYDAYGAGDDDHTRVDLHMNFRSRKQVIDTCNCFFSRLMNKQVGDVTYDENAALVCGASYPEEDDPEYTSEFLIYEGDNSDDQSSLEVEADGVAGRIIELMKSMKVRDDDNPDTLRPLEYRDIVILLRSPSGTAETFKKALEKRSIPVHVAGTEGYFATWEIRTLIHLLEIIVNPLQDISFYGTMVSLIGGFTKEDAAVLKVVYGDSLPEGARIREGYLYEACVYGAENCSDADLREKCEKFLDMLGRYREMSEYLTTEELIKVILRETDYRANVTAMRGGERRAANVDMLVKKAADFGETSYFGLYNFLRYIRMIRKYSLDEAEAEVTDENADAVKIMSIHKSKGLEFPVCFVSGMGKNFNKTDARDAIVIDRKLGMGIRDVDHVKRVKSNTLRRALIADHVLNDTLSEELRVLYVALTRAKEKLILTCACSGAEEKFEKASEKVSGQAPDPVTLRGAAGFYEWLFMAAASIPGNFLNINFRTVDDSKADEFAEKVDLDLKKTQFKSAIEDKEVDITSDPYAAYIEDMYTSSYPHSDLKGLYTKTSVSVLKHAAMPEEDEARFELVNAGKIEAEEAEGQAVGEQAISGLVPVFISGTSDRPGATVRGSAFHRVMELTDIEKMSALRGDELRRAITEELDMWRGSGLISAEQRRIFNSRKNVELLMNFMASSAAASMAAASARGQLYREAPFMMGISAKMVNEDFPEEETVLIQGIIDVYWQEDDGYVILDYKTDRVQTAEKLTELYKTQLDYYKKALDQMHRPVKEELIYSFALDQVIEL